MAREEVFMDHGDQKVVEVPCERIPDGKLGAFVARVHHAKLWHVVASESEADGKIIGEVGLHGSPNPTICGVTQKPIPPKHKFHVLVHDHKHADFAVAMGAAKL